MRLWPGRSRSGWRAWLLAYLLLAVAWPSTGALPWLVLEVGEHVAGGSTPDHDRYGHTADAAQRADDVPGSPTHPLDHHCAQCEVLKHLARCVLAAPVEASVPTPPGDPVVASVEVEPRCASFTATRPTIRGPPLFSA